MLDMSIIVHLFVRNQSPNDPQPRGSPPHSSSKPTPPLNARPDPDLAVAPPGGFRVTRGIGTEGAEAPKMPSGGKLSGYSSISLESAVPRQDPLAGPGGGVEWGGRVGFRRFGWLSGTNGQAGVAWCG